MDQWVQKISLAVILLTAGVTFYATNNGVACWCPGHFSQSQVHYTDTICAKKEANRSLDSSASHIKASTEGLPVKLPTENTTLLLYLAGEAVLVCGLYWLIRAISSSSTIDMLFSSSSLHCSYSKAPSYIVVQILGCFLWAIFGVLTYKSHLSEPVATTPTPYFVCDFVIQSLGRTLRYSVQCTDEGERMLIMSVLTNMALCLVVTVSKLVHLVSAFGFQPFMKSSKTTNGISKGEAKGLSRKRGAAFAFSDLYFALQVNDNNANVLLNIKKNEN